MDNIAEEINLLIKKSSVYNRYLESKKNVDSNEKLRELQCKMKEIKDINCKSNHESLIGEYYKLEQEYNNHVVVKEYQKSREDLYSLLKDISDILYLK